MSGTIVSIRAALESHLSAMAEALPTAYQGGKGFTPVDGAPFQHCAVLWGQPVDTTQGRKLTLESGMFQVTLMYPEGDGTGDAEAQADAVRAWFKPPQVLINGSVRVQITKTARITAGFPSDGRWAVPISIPWESWIAG
jgi:hypothetical protein